MLDKVSLYYTCVKDLHKIHKIQQQPSHYFSNLDHKNGFSAIVFCLQIMPNTMALYFHDIVNLQYTNTLLSIPNDISSGVSCV